MNFTDSPYERMMKQVPRPGRGGCEDCKRTRKRCNRKCRALLVGPPIRKTTLGQNVPKSL